MPRHYPAIHELSGLDQPLQTALIRRTKELEERAFMLAVFTAEFWE
jgi:hypothetical protein